MSDQVSKLASEPWGVPLMRFADPEDTSAC